MRLNSNKFCEELNDDDNEFENENVVSSGRLIYELGFSMKKKSWVILELRLHKLTVALKTQSLGYTETVYFFILFLMKNTNLLCFHNRANDLTKQ